MICSILNCLICLYFQERFLWRKCFLAKSKFSSQYTRTQWVQRPLYIYEEQLAGMLQAQSLVSSCGPWHPHWAPGQWRDLRVSVRGGSGRSAHVHTCASRPCDDRPGHRSRLCWVIVQVSSQGAAFPPHPPGTTWPYTGSLTQGPSTCACNEKEARLTWIKLARSNVSLKRSLEKAWTQM